MNDENDFSTGHRGAVVPHASVITLSVDGDVIDWFRAKAEASGGGEYHSLINIALRDHIQHAGEPLEAMLRRVVREELRGALHEALEMEVPGETTARWTDEAQRRYEELRSGEAEGVPAEDVFARIRSHLDQPDPCRRAPDHKKRGT